jgi:hypothetical protein
MATLSVFDDVPESSSGWDFKSILVVDDNWELRPIEIEEVGKMLGCCDPKGGFVTLLCLKCGHEKRIPYDGQSNNEAHPFSCKGRLCSRCGKRHTDQWVEAVR